jgi:hypothetical protein
MVLKGKKYSVLHLTLGVHRCIYNINYKLIIKEVRKNVVGDGGEGQVHTALRLYTTNTTILQ